MSWKNTISKAKLSPDAQRELKDSMKEVTDGIRMIQNQFKKTPETERNKYDREALKKVLNTVVKRLIELETDLNTLYEFDDFEFADVITE